jgi:hypothetical protein
MLNDTQVPAPRVAIAEDSGVPTRQWFRFFSNLYDFIGLGTGAVPPTSGGTGQNTYVAGDLLYADAANSLARLPVGGDHCYLGTDATNMPQWVQVAYGAYYDTTSPSFTANTPTIIPIGTVQFERNMTLGANRVTIDQTGTYTVTFSIQLTNASANDDRFIVWLRVDGANSADTASYVSVLKKHGSDNGSALVTVNLFCQFTAGQYFELYGLSKLGYAQVNTYAASSSPAYPRSPGVILTVAQVV